MGRPRTKKPKPRPKPKRGNHSVEIDGAIVFSGNITMFRSAKHFGRYIIIADSKDLNGIEIKDSKE